MRVVVGGVLQAESRRPRWLGARGQNRLERRGALLPRGTWQCTVATWHVATWHVATWRALVRHVSLRPFARCAARGRVQARCLRRRSTSTSRSRSSNRHVAPYTIQHVVHRGAPNCVHASRSNSCAPGLPHAPRARRRRCGAKVPYPTHTHTHTHARTRAHTVLARKCRTGATVAQGRA